MPNGPSKMKVVFRQLKLHHSTQNSMPIRNIQFFLENFLEKKMVLSTLVLSFYRECLVVHTVKIWQLFM
jgi:hypothetical protein